MRSFTAINLRRAFCVMTEISLSIKHSLPIAVLMRNLKSMRLLKYIIVGAAVGYGINYITKKGDDGRSILDDISDKAPDWFDQAKRFTEETIGNIGRSISNRA
jgi:hypothetical protein